MFVIPSWMCQHSNLQNAKRRTCIYSRVGIEPSTVQSKESNISRMMACSIAAHYNESKNSAKTRTWKESTALMAGTNMTHAFVNCVQNQCHEQNTSSNR